MNDMDNMDELMSGVQFIMTHHGHPYIPVVASLDEVSASHSRLATFNSHQIFADTVQCRLSWRADIRTITAMRHLNTNISGMNVDDMGIAQLAFWWHHTLDPSMQWESVEHTLFTHHQFINAYRANCISDPLARLQIIQDEQQAWPRTRRIHVPLPIRGVLCAAVRETRHSSTGAIGNTDNMACALIYHVAWDDVNSQFVDQVNGAHSESYDLSVFGPRTTVHPGTIENVLLTMGVQNVRVCIDSYQDSYWNWVAVWGSLLQCAVEQPDRADVVQSLLITLQLSVGGLEESMPDPEYAIVSLAHAVVLTERNQLVVNPTTSSQNQIATCPTLASVEQARMDIVRAFNGNVPEHVARALVIAAQAVEQSAIAQRVTELETIRGKAAEIVGSIATVSSVIHQAVDKLVDQTADFYEQMTERAMDGMANDELGDNSIATQRLRHMGIVAIAEETSRRFYTKLPDVITKHMADCRFLLDETHHVAAALDRIEAPLVKNAPTVPCNSLIPAVEQCQHLLQQSMTEFKALPQAGLHRFQSSGTRDAALQRVVREGLAESIHQPLLQNLASSFHPCLAVLNSDSERDPLLHARLSVSLLAHSIFTAHSHLRILFGSTPLVTMLETGVACGLSRPDLFVHVQTADVRFYNRMSEDGCTAVMLKNHTTVVRMFPTGYLPLMRKWIEHKLAGTSFVNESDELARECARVRHVLSVGCGSVERWCTMVTAIQTGPLSLSRTSHLRGMLPELESEFVRVVGDQWPELADDLDSPALKQMTIHAYPLAFRSMMITYWHCFLRHNPPATHNYYVRTGMVVGATNQQADTAEDLADPDYAALLAHLSKLRRANAETVVTGPRVYSVKDRAGHVEGLVDMLDDVEQPVHMDDMNEQLEMHAVCEALVSLASSNPMLRAKARQAILTSKSKMGMRHLTLADIDMFTSMPEKWETCIGLGPGNPSVLIENGVPGIVTKPLHPRRYKFGHNPTAGRQHPSNDEGDDCTDIESELDLASVREQYVAMYGGPRDDEAKTFAERMVEISTVMQLGIRRRGTHTARKAYVNRNLDDLGVSNFNEDGSPVDEFSFVDESNDEEDGNMGCENSRRERGRKRRRGREGENPIPVLQTFKANSLNDYSSF